MASKLHKTKRRRRIKKGRTDAPHKVTYTETKPTGEMEYRMGGPVPVYETKQKTDVIPAGTKGKEVYVYKKDKKTLKKVKRKFKTDDAVYKSKTKVIQHGKYKGRVLECKGPGTKCGSDVESVKKRKRIFKKKKK